MIGEEILELTQQVDPSVTPKDITALNGGFSSQGYEVNASQPFVLLTHRAGGVSAPRYADSYVVLKLLEQHGFRHAPRALWLHPEHKAIALSLFKGVAANEYDFIKNRIDSKQLALAVIDELIAVTGLSWDEYAGVSRKLGTEPLPVKTSADSAKQYGTDWLEIVEAGCPDSDIIDWLKLRVPRSVAAMQQQDDKQPNFSHGDSSNPNILIDTSGDWTLIDWDDSGFSYNSIPKIIAYSTHTVDFMKPHRQAIIEHVAPGLSLTPQQLVDQVDDFRRTNEVFDVNWAAMMMARVATSDTHDDIEKFRHLAYERIALYEESFGKE